jgi:large subunit ribosomal protein L4
VSADIATTTTPVPVRRRRERPAPERRTVARRRIDGTSVEEVVLDPEIFGIVPNVALLHQVVTAQLAAARAGTHSTRTRSEKRGGGAKPYRQKGTGRARQGSIRAPQWTGGGVALGPKPRTYAQHTPKKMIQLALRSALSDRAAEGRVALVDEWSFPEPRTKDAVDALGTLELEGQVLVVLGPDDGIADRSFANLPRAQTVQRAELNAYDVIRSDWVVFTDATLPGRTEPVEGAQAAKTKPRRAAAPRKASDAEQAEEEPNAEGGPEPAVEPGREEAAHGENSDTEAGPPAEAGTAGPARRKARKAGDGGDTSARTAPEGAGQQSPGRGGASRRRSP